jgi:WD40 repeat protein
LGLRLLRPLLLFCVWSSGDCRFDLAPSAPQAAAAAQNTVAAIDILRTECLGCHGPEKQKAGLRLDSRAAALQGGEQGPVLVPRNPGASLLLKVLDAAHDPHMPPKKQLASAQIEVLRRWIRQGAVWDPESIAPKTDETPQLTLGPLPQSYRPAMTLAVNGTGTLLAASRGGQISVYDLTATNWPVVRRFEAHHDTVQALAWLPGSPTLASGGYQRLALWDPAAATLLHEFTNAIQGHVTALAVLDAGERIAVADSIIGRRATIRILSTRTGREDARWEAHRDTIYALEPSPVPGLLASAGGDGWVRFWTLATHQVASQIEAHSGAVLGLAFDTNGTRLASVGTDRELRIWDLSNGSKLATLGQHKASLSAVRWSRDGSAILAATDSGAVWRYTELKTHTGEQSSAAATEKRLEDTGETVLALHVTPHGTWIFAATHEGTVYAWDRDGKRKAKLTADPDPPQSSPAIGPVASNSAPTALAETRPAKRRRSGPGGPGNDTPIIATPSFVRDVLPVLSKAGCNTGACHAKAEGQNGFKLSVFSHDPRADHAEIVKEARGRRVFPAAPEASLILRKPLLDVPHEGGRRFEPGSDAHQLLLRWISHGMLYQVEAEPQLARITVTPAAKQFRKRATGQLRVQAHYTDGSSRDVTALSAFESSDKELAQVDESGRLTLGNSTGNGVVVARYMGLVAPASVSIASDRRLPASRYAALPAASFIDTLAYAHFQRLGLLPSATCTDAEFLRRASLDAIGLLPTPDEVRAFLADPEPSDLKRQRAIDRLLEHPAYADHWARQFADLVRPNPDRVGVKSVYVLDQWLRESFRTDKPYDQFAREILLAEGSNHRDGPAVIYRDRREPADLTTMFSQVFLGTRLECARCHHHPSEQWSQDDFYRFAAFFASVKQKGAGLSPPISAGTEAFYHSPGGSVKHPVTGAVMTARPLDASQPVAAATAAADPRAALADWLTAPDNPFFARAIVNRVWANFFGRGLVDPVDDFRVSNPCANQPLLDALAADFVRQGFRLKPLMRAILRSRLYQLSSEANPSNRTDTRHFSRAYRRRLSAEVLADAVNDVTDAPDTMIALPAGARTAQAWSYKVDSATLDAFGRPNASSDCPCERDQRLSVVQALHLMHATELQKKLSHDNGRVRRLVDSGQPPRAIVEELYLASLGRMPTSEELEAALAAFSEPEATPQSAAEDVLWALLNSAEFLFNH